ncbi:MAG: acyl-CoA dehydratase activase [bacterium]
MKKNVWIGIDVGSISVKLAVLFRDEDGSSGFSDLVESGRFFLPEMRPSRSLNGLSLLVSEYLRHRGEPLECLADLMKHLFERVPEERVAGVWATGSGGKRCREAWGFGYLNAFRASAEGVGAFYPDVQTIFEMGGERSKYILLSREGNGEIQILDYETNGECAAGTGSFFDQQVDRLKYRIEEVGEVVEDVKRSASIAGRCSVFAKSDMIHAQQRGYQPPEVLKGLCEAVVRNFKGCVTKGKRVEPRVAFIGGVAANGGVVEAFRNHFDFAEGDFIVPELYAWMGAVGCALDGFRESSRHPLDFGRDLNKKGKKDYPTTRPLSLKKVRLLRDRIRPYRLDNHGCVDGYLGIDVGSVSTNLALIDHEGELIHGIYRMTDGRPVEIVRECLKEMVTIISDRVRIRGVGTTGSGRELIGLLVGADVVKDEITAHKTGALHISRKYLDREVDTIFEVGGQDSKFISMKDGVVVDFSLNEACAAGTGSFLEEQAKQIGVAIRGEFAELALRSKHPLRLGERCTVFMEKELVPYLQQGVPKEDIVAGLALSVVQNYLNRVVKKRRIGEVVFFQGGTAYNDSVAAAFATVLDREIVVPPHNGILGAVGAALLARSAGKNGCVSAFRGWDLDRVSWKQREFTCKGCSNACAIQEFEVEGEKSYWGDKCSDRYRKRTKTDRKAAVLDLFRVREDLLFDATDGERSREVGKRGRVGIPRVLYFYDRLPFWRAYFETLGYEVVLSGPSQQHLIHAGVEASVAEPCFPIQAAHGHVLDLMEQDADFIFLPNVVNEEDPSDSVASFVCPWGQTIPLVVKHTPAMRRIRERLFYPNVQFRAGRMFVERKLAEAIARFGIQPKENSRAVQTAYDAQIKFQTRMAEAGRAVLAEMEEKRLPCVVLLGRPYNLYDAGLNLNTPAKLRDLYGANVLPMDFLPLNGLDIRSVHDHMFWNYGRKILQAALFTKDYPDFHLIYISNFKCGPDSYIRHYVEKASGRPFLFLQLDAHANDAGVMTRIEAFLESKGMI